MLIKKPISDFKIRSYLKKKSILIVTLLVLNSIIFTFVGIYIHKNGHTFLARKFVTYENSYRLNVIKNFIKKPFIKVEKIYLDINFSNFKKLNENRNIAVKNKVIAKEYNENVNATINYKDKRVPVRIKLKGGQVYRHLGDNWSFKIRTTKSNVLGLKDFSLMHAERRNYLLEWYARKMYSEEGLIYKDYKFVNLYINGENKGIYVMDENYTDALSVKNNRTEGIYIRFGTDIIFYWKGSQSEDKQDPENESMYQFILNGCCGADDLLQATNIDTLNQQINLTKKKEIIKNFNIAKRLLEDLRTNKKKADEIFDLDLMAKAFALSDLLDSWHAMHWINMRWYYNPITTKLEPIIDDNYDETTTNTNKYRIMRIADSYNHGLLYDKLFKSKVFVKKYIFYLNKYSKPNFVKNFNNKIKKDFDTNLSSINKFKSFYFFPHYYIEENRKRIEKFLNPYQPLYFSMWDQINKNSDKSEITLKVGNTSMLPIEIDKIEIIDENNTLNLVNLDKNLLDKTYFEPRFFKKPIKYKYLSFDLDIQGPVKKVTLYYNIVGLKKTLTKTLDYPIISKKSDAIIFDHNLDTTSNFDFIESFQDQFLITKGENNITENLIIPKDKELIISAGANINLLNGAKIISNSRVIAEGTPENPIRIFSSDKLGECILVREDTRKSIFKNVYFNNLSNCSDETMELRGAVTFYKTQVLMKNIYFTENIRGDDYLNIINSKFDLKNLSFTNSHADALDIDYSRGKIENIIFNKSKNDAIDLSNSSTELKNFKAKDTGDKAISVGENSYLYGENIVIENSFIGLAVKDQSEADLKNIEISDSNIGLATYIKKQEYNSSIVEINRLLTNNNLTEFIIEDGSKVQIDGKNNENFEINVLKKIYPLKNSEEILTEN